MRSSDFTLELVSDAGDVTDPFLRERCASDRARSTKCFVVRNLKTCCGLLKLDFWGDYCRIYETWVLAPYRRHGVATRMIQFAHDEANRRGLTRLIVEPHHLEGEMKQADLEAWYRRLGFEPAPRGREWEKSLGTRVQSQ